MVGLIAKRLLAVIPTLLFITMLVILLLDLTPGDPAEIAAGELATAEDVARIRHELGLDKPLVVRYVDYVSNAARGDLGRSIFISDPVTTMIGRSLPVTLSVGAVALLMAVLLGVPSGVAAALQPLGRADRIVSAVTSVVLAFPPFVVALVLVTLVAIEVRIFPATGFVPFSTDPVAWLGHVVLPAASLCVAPAAQLARQTRGAFVDALEADYVRTARAKGMPEWIVVAKHAAKNAAIPIVTVFGLQLGGILSGAVVVENIFGLPGIGTMTVLAASSKDYPVIQGSVLVTGLVFILANLLVDISYGYFNPKVRT